MKQFAEISWCAEHIQELTYWSIEECEQFLSENEEAIKKATIEAGWVIIGELI